MVASYLDTQHPQNITEIIRNFLTRIDQHHLYDEEFEWTLNLTHNLQYHILLRINRVQNQ